MRLANSGLLPAVKMLAHETMAELPAMARSAAPGTVLYCTRQVCTARYLI
jgi:hypothetical protein